jgi:carboxyl-terminal processing protease
LVDEVWQIIDRQYVDGTFNHVDWQAVRKQYLSRSYTSKEDAYKAVREMLKKLNDPYTRFMNPEQFKEMQVDTSGELIGIGIQLAQDQKTKKLTVIAPIEDTPAFTAGVLAKDIITKIDGKTTQGMDVNQAVTLIRGQPGTEVKLTILRNGKEKDFPIKRAHIEIRPVRYSYQNSPMGSVGYIRLAEFSANAPAEMRDAIKDLERSRSVGIFWTCVLTRAAYFSRVLKLPKCGSMTARLSQLLTGRRKDIEKANNRALTNKPLVVLVDGGSASASEILSEHCKTTSVVFW